MNPPKKSVIEQENIEIIGTFSDSLITQSDFIFMFSWEDKKKKGAQLLYPQDHHVLQRPRRMPSTLILIYIIKGKTGQETLCSLKAATYTTGKKVCKLQL